MMDSLGPLLILVVGFLLGLTLSPATAGAWGPGFLASFIPQFIATIAGVISGAWIAAYTERKRDERQEHRARATSANTALFTLGRIYSAYANLSRQIVDPARNHSARWYSMGPVTDTLREKIHFDFESLQFLIQSKNPGVLAHLDMWEHRYHTLAETLRQRTRVHVEELQPRMDAAGIRGESVDRQQLEQVAGQRIQATLAGLTDVIIQNADDGMRQLPTLLQDVLAAAAPMVGNEKLIKLTISDQAEK